MDNPAAVPVPLVELLTRPGCHLCADARQVVDHVAGQLGLPWQEVDISHNAALTARYGEEIPVVMVDGVPRDFWQIDPARLHGILCRVQKAQ